MSVVRTLLAILPLWVPGIIIAVTWVAWQDRLLADLPTHWGFSGPADEVTSAPVVFGWLCGIAGAAALLGSELVSLPWVWVQRAIGATAGATAMFTPSMWLGGAAASLDVTDPFTVEL